MNKVENCKIRKEERRNFVLNYYEQMQRKNGIQKQIHKMSESKATDCQDPTKGKPKEKCSSVKRAYIF